MPGQGIIARCALGDETSFQTAVAVTEVIPFTSESINRAIEQLASEYLDGSAGRRRITNSVISIGGGLESELVWDEETGDPVGLEKLIRGFMGASARDAGNGLNKYYFADTLANESFTIVFNKQTSAWEVVSAKVNTMTISGSAGGKCMFSTELIAYNLLRTGDAGITNAIAAVTALSPTNIPQNIMFDDMVFRVADQDNAIASGDQYKISNFELSGNNSLSESEFSTVDSTHTNNLLTLEPLRNGFRELTLSIEIPRYTSDQFFTWLNNNTALQADLKFSSGSYEFNILLPNIHVAGDPTANIGGAELIKPTINFVALMNNGTNTDMTFQDTTAITDEMGIECKSGRSSAA